ncbi:hypothetical protein ACMU_01480 [Actibacterium mucosum KCTC 23349]|uniref:HTH gntR-type domain-containing protein n=1 Tax=Actibacterium mucosum KCTC 23349 TaxID=1454373 RepID=A0A037ZL64_9RHOB|nr:GntR family transcriptional regulator [Actibacterium mucosum]KAJ57191.1 hypothetical protein ACMU_01480 [Actibacterium mucosum KCTC 23349]
MLKGVHSQMISDILEEEILKGELTPGTRLSEQSIAARFGVSRTPVREALQNIASRSLVERLPYKGVIVRDLDTDRIDMMFEAMAELEALCGGLAAERIREDELNRLERMHLRMSEMAAQNASRDYEAINLDFHSLIYKSCGNEDLSAMAHDMRIKLAPFRKTQLFRVERLQMSNREHAVIVQLLATRNKAGTQEALRRHLEGAKLSFSKARS